MKNHVAVVLTAHPHGGGKFQYSLSILDAVRSLEKDRYRVSLVYFDDDWLRHIPRNECDVYRCGREIVGSAIRKLALSLPPVLPAWRSVNRLVHPLHRLLHRLNPDLVFYPGNDSYAYESRFPAIAPIFDLMHRYEPSFPEASSSGLARKRDAHYRNICRRARAILVDSEVGRKHVLESYDVDANRIFVLPFVAPPYIHRYKGDVDVVGKYGLPERFIFYPAQLWKHKNHVGLLRAMSLLKERGLIVNAVFTGSRENGTDETFAAVDDLGLKAQVSFLSYVNDEEMVSLYRRAIALVMPTFFGPTNIPQLEAFTLGCPVLTSNIYGIPEQVGEAALLFDPHDVQDMAKNICGIWENEDMRNNLVLKGHEKAAMWNQEKFNKITFSIIDEIIDDLA